MSITLKNLNITVSITVDDISVTSNKPANPLAAALLAALSGTSGGSGSVSIHRCDHEGEPDAAPVPEGEPDAAPVPEGEPDAAPGHEGNGSTAPTRLTPADVQSLVMDALHDERYNLRTFDGLAKAVQKSAAPTPVTPDDIQDAVSALVDDGEVYTRRRSSDGAALYGAA